MTSPLRALFDTEALREVRTAAVGLPHHPQPMVVLGSRQPSSDVDVVALRRDDVELRRRRGGGGAVFLHPADVWCEVWLPREGTGGDVRRTAARAGAVWQRVLRAAGVATDLHQGGLLDGEQGSVACFAGLGPGELTVNGSKLVGLSQWRVREGTLISTVLAWQPPNDLASYLSHAGRDVPRLTTSTCLEQLTDGTTPAELSGSLVHELIGAWPDLVDVQLTGLS